MTIGQFGTFEVENYGDRLFPLIASKELASRLPNKRLQQFSPLAGPEITPIINQNGNIFSEHMPLEATLIGGGDIISFASEIASIYKDQWKYPISPHNACWALPIIHRNPGAPVIWNAPGVPKSFTKDQTDLVRYLAHESDYLSVRDETSLKRLQEAGVKKEISVIPDTALMISKHYPKDTLIDLAKKNLDPLGLKIGEYLVIQTHPYYVIDHIPSFTANILSLKEKLNLPILLLPIGRCHHDEQVLKQIKEASQESLHLIETSIDTLEIAAIIAHAGAFVGTSLHGNITAFSYGIPFLICGFAPLSKLEGFANLIKEEDRIVFNENQIPDKWELLEKIPSKSNFENACKTIENHFDAISDLIVSAKPNQANGAYQTMMMKYLTLIPRNEALEQQIQITEHHLKHKENEVMYLQHNCQSPAFFHRLLRKFRIR